MSDLSINLLNELSKNPFIFTTQPDVFNVRFSTSNDPFRLRRVHKVAQMVAKILLTNRGSDTYAPEIGTGIRSLLHKLVSPTNLPTLKRDIALWVRDAEDQLKDEQEKDAFPLDERVANLILRTADFSFTTLTWTIRIQIETEAGNEAIIDITPQVSDSAVDDDLTVGVRDVLTIDPEPI